MKFTKIIKYISKSKPIYLIIISVILTSFFVSCFSIIFHNRITYDYLITGFITSLIVSFIIINIVYVYQKELKNSEEKLKKSESSLLELNAKKDTFFSLISHDLRNPFNPLIGFTEMCLNKFDTLNKEKIKELIIRINKSAKFLYDLLENILLWSSIQTNKIEYHPIKFTLNELVDNSINFMRDKANKKSISMSFNFANNTYIYADPKMIHTVLTNLISNAIKFTHQGGKIKLSSIDNNGVVEIYVSDEGIGIISNDIDKLFKLKNRFTTNGTANEKGNGLGLLICKDLLKINNGNISVESKVNKGTTVKITLVKAN
ncbi:MAG: HAMP domain-containing histidine kinase [Spirochaetota bacterium]|nr:HAMP domain-containing histidine kinase [Spirochaetota bacterium]